MRKIQIGFITVFLFAIAWLGICTLDNDAPSNVDEMRSYNRFPDLESYADLLDVNTLNKISDAYDDQLEGRADMVKFYYQLQVNVMRQKLVGTIVIGKDNVLFNKPFSTSNQKKYLNNVKTGAELINEVAEKAKQYGTKVIVVDVPRRDVNLESYVPSWYISAVDLYEACIDVQREALNDDIAVIDVNRLFHENAGADTVLYWYYNDHHINAIGNDLILSEIIKLVQEDYPEVTQKRLEDYDIEYTQVYGALNRKIGLAASAPDEPLWMTPKGWEISYTRSDNGKESKEPVLRKIDERQKRTYSETYMGDNFGETIVDTDRDSLPSIFFCGSSFTNALEALSVPSFDNMYSVDFRYNTTTKDINDYIAQWQPEYVVLIPGQSTATFNLKHLKTHLGYLKEDIDYD